MRVLLDENLPRDLRAELAGHEVETVQSMKWSSTTNGELLKRVYGNFDAFVTMDRSLEFQHNLSQLPFGVLVVRARSNRMIHLRPLVPEVQEALASLQPGEVRHIGV